MTIIEIKSVNFPYISVKFSDGTIADINMEQYFSEIKNIPLIEKILSSKEAFDTVSLGSGTLIWYDVGFSPDEIYEEYFKSIKLLQHYKKL